MTRSNLYQRLFAGLWLLACVGLAVAGWRYQAPFSYEPVGPRAYPLLCLALMGAGLAWLIARPTPCLLYTSSPATSSTTTRKAASNTT